MQAIFYQGYVREYKSALELLQKRGNIGQYKNKLNEEKKQKLLHLKSLITEVTQVKARQLELTQIEETIKTKSAHIEKTSTDIEAHRKRCQDKQTRTMHWYKIINLFRKEFTEEFKQNEKKYQELNTLEVIHLSRQRLMLYELGSYLLNETIADFIYIGMYELHKNFREQRKENKIGNKSISLLEINLSPANKENEISTGLGYCVLLLNTLSKYLNVPLKFPMYFCGTMSIIMRKQNENYPLYITKVFDKNKFHAALRHLIQNIMQILEYFEVDINERKPSFRKQMETLIRILHGQP